MTERVPRVYIDANVFILAYETVGSDSLQAFAILEAVEAGAIHGVSSELTLGEILPGPLNHGETDLATAYDQVLSDAPNMTVLSVTRDILVSSAEIRVGRPGFKLQDAIHCAIAQKAGCDFMVSDDRRIPKTLGFTVVRFGPDSLDTILGSLP